MFSRGSINGEVLNALPLNGGSFVEEASGACEFSVVGSIQANRRLTATGAASIALVGTAGISLRLRVGGVSSVGMVASGYAARRAAARGVSELGVDLLMTAARRVNLQGTSPIAIDGMLVLSHTFLRRTAPRRIMEMRPELRNLDHHGGRRQVTVPRELTNLTVAKDRRSV